MNLCGGWALIANTWTRWMGLRAFFFIIAFGWMVPPLVYLFVWTTAIGEATVGGLDREAVLTYYLVLIVVNKLTASDNSWTVGDAIRDGTMSTLLLRPLPPLYHALADELSSKVMYMLFTIPVAAGLAVVLRPELHLLPRNGLLFVPALALAWALRFFWDY